MKTFKTVICLFPLLLISVAAAMLLGSANVLSLLESDAETALIILLKLRLPRVLAAIIAGVGLSVSGVLLQSVTGNSLASPNIIGVNAGAGFCCIFMLTFLPSLSFLMPLGAFIGAFLTTLLIVAIAKKISSSFGTVILAGIAVNAVLNAAISFLSLLDADVLSTYNSFSVGGLRGVNLSELWLPLAIVLVCLFFSLLLSRRIHTLCLGDSLAASLGVRVARLRTVCLVLASASAAAVVSFAGLLGFVGLVVPHISRKISGERTSRLLITSAFVGAILVTLSDLFGRILLSPTEIPVGIIMALIGAPFFFILLLRRRDDNA